MNASAAAMPERLLKAMIDPDASPWLHAFFVFIAASFAGLASHLREGGSINARMVTTAMLNSGLLGLIVFLLGYSRMGNDMPFLIGFSLLAGVGSASLMTFAVQLAKRRLAAMLGIDLCPLPPSEEKPK